jgi:hypothetical protein
MVLGDQQFIIGLQFTKRTPFDFLYCSAYTIQQGFHGRPGLFIELQKTVIVFAIKFSVTENKGQGFCT